MSQPTPPGQTPMIALEPLEQQLRLGLVTLALSEAARCEGERVLSKQPIQTVAELETRARALLVALEGSG